MRRAPIAVLIVPSGQTQPQKKRPRTIVSATVTSERRNTARTACEASSALSATSGSKSRKSRTGRPSSFAPLYSVWTNR